MHYGQWRRGRLPDAPGSAARERCSVASCNRPSERTQEGVRYCGMHRARARRGQPLDPPPKPTTCAVTGCEKDVGAKGYCAMHYARSRKNLSLDAPARTSPYAGQHCKIDGCTRPAKARQMCDVHYGRSIKGRPMDAPIREVGLHTVCTVDGCDRPHAYKRLCKFHGQRQRHGIPLDQTRKAPTGVRRVLEDGYVSVYHPNHPNATSEGRILEHRFVMAEHLGRPLAPTETVHHRDGDRENNDLSNLELWSRAQPAGQRVEDLLPYWVAQIRLYAPQLLAAGVDITGSRARPRVVLRPRGGGRPERVDLRATARSARHGRGQGAARGASRRGGA